MVMRIFCFTLRSCWRTSVDIMLLSLGVAKDFFEDEISNISVHIKCVADDGRFIKQDRSCKSYFLSLQRIIMDVLFPSIK